MQINKFIKCSFLLPFEVNFVHGTFGFAAGDKTGAWRIFSFGKTSGKLFVVSDLNYLWTDESESLDQLQTLLHQRHLALGERLPRRD